MCLCVCVCVYYICITCVRVCYAHMHVYVCAHNAYRIYLCDTLHRPYTCKLLVVAGMENVKKIPWITQVGLLPIGLNCVGVTIVFLSTLPSFTMCFPSSQMLFHVGLHLNFFNDLNFITLINFILNCSKLLSSVSFY